MNCQQTGKYHIFPVGPGEIREDSEDLKTSQWHAEAIELITPEEQESKLSKMYIIMNACFNKYQIFI